MTRWSGVFLLVLAPAGGAGCGGEDTAAPPETLNPKPTLALVRPEVIPVGSGDTELSMLGQGLRPYTTVMVDGVERPATQVSAGELRVTLPAGVLSLPRTGRVRVINPPPGGGVSNEVLFAVGYRSPGLTALLPNRVELGSEPVTISLIGSEFSSGNSVVTVDGADFPTTVLAPDRLTFDLPGSLLAAPAVLPVLVRNPPPGGGISQLLDLTVGDAGPVLTGLTPMTASRGVPTRFSASGHSFTPMTRMLWNGQPRPTTYVGPTLIYTDLPAADLASAGIGRIALQDPPPGGGISRTLEVLVQEPIGRILGFEPSFIAPGQGAFELGVLGGPFPVGAVVRWNDLPLVTARVSDAELSAVVPAEAVVDGTAALVRVLDPASGSESDPVGFPVIDSDPSSEVILDLPLTTRGLAGDPLRELAYVSVPAASGEHSSSILAFDPEDGAIEWSLFVGGSPGVLEVTDGGAFLYVAMEDRPSVLRVDLTTRTVDLEIEIEPVGSGNERAEDIVALPGSPETIVVALRNTCCTPRHEGVAVYDGAVRRPLLTQPHTGSNRIEPSDHPGRIYGWDNASVVGGFRRILVRPDGVLQDGVFENLISGDEIIFDSGLVFTSGGEVIDPETPELLGAYAGSGVVRPDVRNGRVHFIRDDHISTFHLLTQELIGSTPLPAEGKYSTAVRLRTDVLVLAGGTRLVILRSGLIG